MNLTGKWQLCLDPAPCRFDAPPAAFALEMSLPGTTAQQQIGTYSADRADGFLSEQYPFTGRIWLRRAVTLSADEIGRPCFLHLERTRMTRLWVNGAYIGQEQSLCTPHVYDLTAHTARRMELVLCVQNYDYPTRGGHMTSPDTQTNWIGVTGQIALTLHAPVWLDDVQAYPDAGQHLVTLRGNLHGAASVTAALRAECTLYGEAAAESALTVPESVTLHADELSTEQMQKMTHSSGEESVFLLRPTRPDCDVKARYFVPLHEMGMCLHATIGSAYILVEKGIIDFFKDCP